MFKKGCLAALAVFLLTSLIDFLLHGVILGRTYAATQAIWRPVAEMSMPLVHLSVAIVSVCFVAVFAGLVRDKSPRTGALYGLLTGLGAGASMGIGSYAVMSIPLSMALAWLIGCTVKGIIAGYVTGIIIQDRD